MFKWTLHRGSEVSQMVRRWLWQARKKQKSHTRLEETRNKVNKCRVFKAGDWNHYSFKKESKYIPAESDLCSQASQSLSIHQMHEMENTILTQREGNMTNFSFTLPFTTKQYVVNAFREAPFTTILKQMTAS